MKIKHVLTLERVCPPKMDESKLNKQQQLKRKKKHTKCEQAEQQQQQQQQPKNGQIKNQYQECIYVLNI